MITWAEAYHYNLLVITFLAAFSLISVICIGFGFESTRSQVLFWFIGIGVIVFSLLLTYLPIEYPRMILLRFRYYILYSDELFFFFVYEILPFIGILCLVSKTNKAQNKKRVLIIGLGVLIFFILVLYGPWSYPIR